MTDQKNAASRISPADEPEALKDRGGRRRLPDRRQSSSSEHFPERRSLRHRRSGSDRRRRQPLNMHNRIERRRMFKQHPDAEDPPAK